MLRFAFLISAQHDRACGRNSNFSDHGTFVTDQFICRPQRHTQPPFSLGTVNGAARLIHAPFVKQYRGAVSVEQVVLVKCISQQCGPECKPL
jgi:hypothetical protein